MAGGNVGQPIFKVSVLDGSPFQGIPRQEWSYYFTQDNYESLAGLNGAAYPQFTEALPPPWNGLRCAEDMHNYDNFLEDASGTKLEDAQNADGGGAVSPESTYLTTLLTFDREHSKNTPKYDTSADDFFTWNVLPGNFFEPSDTNPSAKSFGHMNEITNNGAKWMYANKVKGDGESVPSIISPFMNNLPHDPKNGVHWSCCTKYRWPMFQPFELLYYNEDHTPDIPKESDSLTPIIKGISGTNGLNIDISKRAYLALEFGARATTEGDIRLLILLVRGISPKLYKISAAGKAVLMSSFQAIDGEDFFSPNTSNMNLKVEQVAFGMIISSNLFTGKQWIVNQTDSGGGPIFLGGDRVTLYGGNVKSGFAIRPVQYMKGTFSTYGQPVITSVRENTKPTFSTSMKGGGFNQASRSSDGLSLHAVDSEEVNGESVLGFVENIARKVTSTSGVRKILIAPRAIDSKASSNVTTTTWVVDVTLTPADEISDSGFVIKNGRSPYLWQIRGTLDPEPLTSSGGSGTDISCAVLSCDLTWNASSFIEFSHTGTLKLLMRPNTGVTIPQSYSNRALYITIDAYWRNGQVGAKNSQRIFTGMSVGATIDQTAETDIMTLQLEDYMNALEGAKFTLSPYYDGMIAKLAVKDIVKQLGVLDANIAINNDTDPTDYGLPFNNPFEQPQFRFKMGSSLKSGILKIAELDLKSVFFDEEGKFHYDPIPGGIFNNEDTTPVENFVTSPRDGRLMQVVWNTISSGRHINDVFNVISVGTVDKETGQPIYLGDAFDDSIFNPSSEGYLGYRKHLIVNDPAIGSVAAAGRYLSTYRDRVKIPPYTYKFETYGRGGLRPLSIVTIDGAPARVMNISMHADAKENNWWMNIECEWFDSAI